MDTTLLKRKVLNAHLPPAACTSEMLKDLSDFADSEHTSMSAVIRHAVALFLAEKNGKSSQKIGKQK